MDRQVVTIKKSRLWFRLAALACTGFAASIAISTVLKTGQESQSIGNLYWFCISLAFLWMLWFTYHTVDAHVYQDGSIQLTFGNRNRSLMWSGVATDVDSICVETYDCGEGDATIVWLQIKSLGSVATHWTPSQARDFANAIGKPVIEKRADSMKKTLEWEELKRSLNA